METLANINWERDRKVYEKRIVKNPNDKEALYKLGVLYDDYEKDIDRARECFEKVIAIDAEYLKAYMRLGRILQQSNEESTERRMRLEESFGERSPDLKFIDFNANKNFGSVMSSMFEEDKKKKPSFKKGKRVNFVRANIHYRIGVILQDLFKEDDLAEEQYRKAISLHDNYSSVYYRLALLQDNAQDTNKGDTYEFEKALEPFREFPDEARAAIYGNLAVVLYNQFGDFKRARDMYKWIIEKDDKDALAHYNLGVICRDKFGEQMKGKELIDRAIMIDSNLLGRVRKSYEERLLENPNEVSELYELGVLLKDYFGDPNQGMKYIDKAIKLEPNYLVKQE